MEGIKYPVKVRDMDEEGHKSNDIEKFEKQNPNISINVYALENPKDIKSIYPLYNSSFNDRENIIDLLYLENNENTHYCLLKNINSILSNNRSRHLCRRCTLSFTTKQALNNHQIECGKNELAKPIMPEPGNNILKFKNHRSLLIQTSNSNIL